MLSEQLIKNNVVALTELAKNSYDADASWVRIRVGNMANFGKDELDEDAKPFVEIEDDGDGMSFETIRDAWMNPASPNKYMRRKKRTARTRRGRVLQGEKGIGRYAVFQIGKKVEIFTRARINDDKGGKETNLVTDLSGYTEELISDKDSPDEPLFFDQIQSTYQIRDGPIRIKPGNLRIEGYKHSRKNHGTLIRITELNYKWTLTNVKRVREILSRLQSPFRRQDFSVGAKYEESEVLALEDFDLEDVLDEALLEMVGKVDEHGVCEYTLKGKRGVKEEKESINLVENLRQDAIPANRGYFLDEKGENSRDPECGPFGLRFFVYNFNVIQDKKLKAYIRSHRTYIYRDDIRVYPYGDQDNDWIKLDIHRGSAKVGFYLSNDQVIGYVSVSSEGNPDLRDKTNREGLLEQGRGYEDLRFLTLSALNFLHTEYQKTITEKRPKRRKGRRSKLFLQSEKVQKRIDEVESHLKAKNDLTGQQLLNKLSKDYHQEKRITETQIQIVEDLAGVGIAVDATSHDVMLVMGRAHEKVNESHKEVHSDSPDLEALKEKIDALREQCSFAEDLLVGIQPIFRSARRKNKELKISDIVRVVKRYYDTPLRRIVGKVDITEEGPPLVVTSSEGALLQLFINLMDNSVYWLKVSRTKEPRIEVLIDGDRGYVVFADNGPGIGKKNVDYIFEPFFSTKGIQGRGLGLYIARQLTDKYEYDLYYLEDEKDAILPGANFRIDFFDQEEEEEGNGGGI